MNKIISILLIFPCLLSISRSTSSNFLKSFNGMMPNNEVFSIVYSSSKAKEMLTNNNSVLGEAIYSVDIVESTATGPYVNKGTAYTVFYSVLLSLYSSCTYKNGLFDWFVSDDPKTNLKEVAVTTTVSKYSSDNLIFSTDKMMTEENISDAYFVTKGEENIYNSAAGTYDGELKGCSNVTKNNYGYLIPYYKKYYDKSWEQYLDSYGLIDYICDPDFSVNNTANGFEIIGNYNFATFIYSDSGLKQYITQESVGICANSNTKVNKDVWLYGYFSIPAEFTNFDIAINANSVIYVGSGSIGDTYKYNLDQTYTFNIRL